MDNEELQRRYDHLVDRVRRMRAYQNAFKKYKASDDYNRARSLEWQVDQIIAKEVKVKKSKQRDMF